MTYLLAAALVAGLALGFVAGFVLRRRAWHWCVQCGESLGTTCVTCRDRTRATALHARNERSTMLAGTT
jgi:hypothetical protein